MTRLWVFAGFTAIFGAFHATSPNLLGVDGYFHIKFSRTVWENGLPDVLPFLSQTIFADRFVDDHLLFHLIQIPFTSFGLIPGAKIYASLVAGLAFALFFAALQQSKIAHPLIWTLGLACSSQAFISRLGLARVSGLSVCLLLTGTLLILQRKDRWVGPLAFAYVWLYGGFPLLLLICVIAFCVDACHHLPTRWGLLGWALGGTLLGIVTHPYFPAHVDFLWTSWTKIELGQFPRQVTAGIEDYPYPTTQAVRHAFLPWVLSLATFAAYLLLPRRLSAESTFLFAASILFLALFMSVRRFVEYWPPFAFLFAAHALDPILLDWIARSRARRRSLAVSVFALLVIFGFDTYSNLHAEFQEARNLADYRAPAKFLQQESSVNEIVFNADWSDFPLLYHLNTHNRYIAGLAPHYLHERNGAQHMLWRKVVDGRLPEPSSIIQERFGSRWVFGKRGARLIKILRKDPNARLAYEDKFAVIFLLGKAPTDPA